MRVALVTETFPPEVNGVAMTLQRLTVGLAQRGHPVTVIRARQHRGDADSTGGPLSQRVVAGMPLPRYQGLHLGLPAAGRLRRWWSAERPDVVHVATEGPLGVSAMRAAVRLGIARTSSFHTNFHQYGRHYGYGAVRGLVMRYLRWVHSHAAATMVPSADVRDALQASGFANVRVIGRGVDCDLFNPLHRSDELRRQWGAGDDDPIALYVGRIAGEKNIELALQAHAAMRAADPRCRLVLVGDGPLRPQLERQHPQVIFACMRRGADLARYYASADMFIFPSVTETFGNVVTEALTSGLVVLTYDYAAGRQHIVPGRSSVLAPFDDGPAFIAAAGEIMRRREHWPAIRSAARAAALGISWDAIIEQFQAMLADAADSLPAGIPA